MKLDAKNLRDLVERTRLEFESAKRRLESYELNCKHDFGEPVYEPIYHKAYTVPGDAPGTMGVDWRGPCHVPASTDDRWKRECKECGLVEYTRQVIEEKIVKKRPNFGGRR